MKARGLMLTLGLAAITSVAHAQEPITAADCSICHEDVVDAFLSGPHGRAMEAQDGVVDWSCVACHGPAEAHLDEPAADNISRQPGGDACLGCHPDSESKIELFSSAHNRNGVACLECHGSGHADTGVEPLLLDEPQRMCAGCHRIVENTFRLPYAHRNGAEPFACTDCHTTHGDTRIGRLELIAGGGVCSDCHVDQVRPFVFAHPPADRFGCIACHRPHGSPNPKLLTRRSISLLCLECHAGVPAFHDVSQPRFRNCQNCHAAIHGSNRDPQLIEE